MTEPELITGLQSRIVFRDYLSKTPYEQLEQVQRLHQVRTSAVEQSKQAPARKAKTKSATKNQERRKGASSAQNQLAKLLAKMSPEDREALINQAKGES